MRSRVVVIGLLGVLLLVVAAGCGGKKKSASTTTVTTSSSSGGSGGSSSGGSGGSSGGSGGSSSSGGSSGGGGSSPSFASAKNCVQLAQLASKIASSFNPASQNPKDAAKALTDEMNAFAAASPDEIKGDFKTFADVFGKYESAIAKAGYTPGKTPTASQIAALTEASKSFDTPKLQAAEAHLEAWGKKNCPSLTGTG